MLKLNQDITAEARAMLKGNWRLPILGALVFCGISCLLGCIPVIGWIASLAIAGPLFFGYCAFFLAFARKKGPRLEQMFDGFHHFANTCLAYVLMVLFIILWALLLIVPGIIAALRYSQTFFILADNPDLDGIAAINKSKEMMAGNTWQLFCLACRFFGWSLLGVLTLGIGFIWIVPYLQTSLALFYEEVKSASANNVGTSITMEA